jgi:putative glutamine amidotransferase
MPSDRPLVLISTGTGVVDLGLRRENVVTGRNYAQAVLAEGGLPMLVSQRRPGAADDYVARADALLLSGGADVDPARFGQPPHPDLGVVDPERDAFEIALYRAARAAGKPVLGVCRGIQLINVAEGGSLHQHLPALGRGVQHSQADKGGRPHHRVTLAAGSRSAAGFGAARPCSSTPTTTRARPPGRRGCVPSPTPRTASSRPSRRRGRLAAGRAVAPGDELRGHPDQRAPFRGLPGGLPRGRRRLIDSAACSAPRPPAAARRPAAAAACRPDGG